MAGINLKNKKGQSSIEFVLTFSLIFSFIFLFLKMALNYTDGYMLHHAVYMASRAFLVQDNGFASVDDGDQQAFQQAQRVFQKYAPSALLPEVDSGSLQANYPDSVPVVSLVGVYASIEKKFSVGLINIPEPLVLRSESFLGREPSRQEAMMSTCFAIAGIFSGGAADGCETHVTIDDNGN